VLRLENTSTVIFSTHLQITAVMAMFNDAPSRYLRFPSGEIATAEMIAFLPNWLRSHDVVFRLSSNGIANRTAAHMVNYYRTASRKGPTTDNTICKMFQKTMRDTGYYMYQINDKQVEWTIGHHQRVNTKDTYGPWISQNLSLAGMQPDTSDSEGLIDNIPFHYLARGVLHFPDVATGDGLILTRCVQYAQAHPNTDLQFPRDFERLTKYLGTIKVRTHHYDEATFKRWDGGRVPNASQPSLTTRAPVMPAHGLNTHQSMTTFQAAPIPALAQPMVSQLPRSAPRPSGLMPPSGRPNTKISDEALRSDSQSWPMPDLADQQGTSDRLSPDQYLMVLESLWDWDEATCQHVCQ
jgi:hypothetical protein